jgi:hypothetical protein
MGKSHQTGWVSLRGKRWFGYFRQTVLDPETNEERVKKICVKLAHNAKMTKTEARDALRTEVTKQTGQNLGGRVLKDSSTTFGWFVRNRYFPLREGDWRPETAKFEEYPLDSIDKFMLQTHINNLADGYHRNPPGIRKLRLICATEAFGD